MSNINKAKKRQITIPIDLHSKIKIENSVANQRRIQKNKPTRNTEEEMLQLMEDGLLYRKALVEDAYL